MERYLGGEEVDAELLVEDLERAVARGLVLPRRSPSTRRPASARAELLDLVVAGFPSPLEHPLPDGLHPGRQAEARRITLRPRRAAGRRGREDHHRPVRRTRQPGPGVLRHRAPRRDGARVRPLLRRSSASARAATRTTTRTSASARCPIPLGKTQRPAEQRRRRRHLRDRQAQPGRDRRHPVRQGQPARAQAVEHARAAAAARDPGPGQGRRGQAGHRACSGSPPRTRRCASSTTPRPTRSCCGRMGEAHADVLLDRLEQPPRRRPSTRSSCGCRCARRSPRSASGHGRHVKQSGGHGQYAVCDIEVEPLPQGRASSSSTRSSAARCPASSSRRWRRACAPRWSKGCVGRLPGRRHQGDPHRRQGAQRRLLRHGVPDRRRARAARGRRGARRSPCSSRSTSSPCSSPTTWSAP